MGDMDFVTVPQAAKYLGLSEQEVLRLIDRGFLAAEQIGLRSATGDDRQFSIMGRRLKQCQAEWLDCPEWRKVATMSDVEFQAHRLMRQSNLDFQGKEVQL